MALDNVTVDNSFEFECDGITPVAVQTVGGLEFEYSEVAFSVGSDSPLKKQRGRKMVGDVTLGVVTFNSDESMANLREWAESGNKKTAYVKIFDTNKDVVERWELVGCWVKNYSKGDLDSAGDGEKLVTEIVLAVDDKIVF